MIQGRRMSRTDLARDLPAQANPGAKIATRTPVENSIHISLENKLHNCLLYSTH